MYVLARTRARMILTIGTSAAGSIFVLFMEINKRGDLRARTKVLIYMAHACTVSPSFLESSTYIYIPSKTKTKAMGRVRGERRKKQQKKINNLPPSSPPLAHQSIFLVSLPASIFTACRHSRCVEQSQQASREPPTKSSEMD